MVKEQTAHDLVPEIFSVSISTVDASGQLIPFRPLFLNKILCHHKFAEIPKPRALLV
jgi:hypothetical protein